MKKTPDDIPLVNFILQVQVLKTPNFHEISSASAHVFPNLINFDAN